MSKGISYSNWFINDWRKNDKLSICHTGLSHALSIYYFLVDNNSHKIKSKVFYNKENDSFDLAMATSLEKKPLFRAMFCWGAPCVQCKIQILSTNKLLLLEGDILKVRSPRDSFDIDNNFIPPNISLSEVIKNEGIEPSIISFINKVKNQDMFDKKSFLSSMNIGRTCLNAEIIK